VFPFDAGGPFEIVGGFRKGAGLVEVNAAATAAAAEPGSAGESDDELTDHDDEIILRS
jgi:hypothetical protein